jgi:hypothetical protein
MALSADEEGCSLFKMVYSSVISWKTITVAQVGVGGFLSECIM